MTMAGARAPIAARQITVAPTAVLAALSLVALHLTPRLGGLAALMFLICGLALILRRPATALAEVQREIWILGIALWCVLSVVWSAAPMASLRYGILLVLTFGVGIAIASRLSPLGFLKTVFAAYALAGVASLAFGRDRGDGMGFLGLYNSKNAMSASASILMLAGLALLLDRSLPRGLRLAGALGAGLAGLLVIRAQSTGAILAVGAAVAVVGLLIGLARLGPGARLVCLALAGLLAGLAGLAIAAHLPGLTLWFTETTGKDVTLTGRTDLWAVARDQIGAAPLLGGGYQAFWVQGQPMAEALWAQFGIATKTGFHFHNALLSNAVEVGLPAALWQVGAVVWAFGTCVIWALRDQRAETLFLVAFLARQLVLSLSEVPFFIQFDLASLLTVAAIVYACRYRRGRVAGGGRG